MTNSCLEFRSFQMWLCVTLRQCNRKKSATIVYFSSFLFELHAEGNCSSKPFSLVPLCSFTHSPPCPAFLELFVGHSRMPVRLHRSFISLYSWEPCAPLMPLRDEWNAIFSLCLPPPSSFVPFIFLGHFALAINFSREPAMCNLEWVSLVALTQVLWFVLV